MAAAVVILLGLALLISAVGWRTSSTPRHAVAGLLAAALLAVVAGIGAVAQNPGSDDAAWVAVFWTLCALVAVSAGGPATRFVFFLVDGSAAATSRGIAIGKASTALLGGSYIGLLERAAVFGTLATGWPEGLAVVVAVKGLGRYPELTSQDSAGAAERFIIGTFASALWAAACVGTARLFF